MKPFEVAATDIQKTREAMNGRIGEIITAVIGNDTLQRIFEQPENHAKYIELNQKGTPSGIIALDLGIVDTETKTALLVAQAAERTALNAGRMQEIAKGVSVPKEWLLSGTDDVFKFVGSERDPKILQAAQASWQLSQLLLNTANHDATRDPDDISLPATMYLSPRPIYADTLLKDAAHHYDNASKILKRKGFMEAAAKLQAVSKSILPENAADVRMTPHDIAVAYTNMEIQFKQQMNIAMSSNAYVGDEMINLGEKLSRLTEVQKATAPDTAPRKDI